jgi:hypothetical protein
LHPLASLHDDARVTVERIAIALLGLGLTSCASPQRTYVYENARGAKTEMAPVEARVVSAREADASGLAPGTLSIPFAGAADGTKLVQDFLARADARRAYLVSDLAIYLLTTRDGRVVECRSGIVPETFTETRKIPSRYESVAVSRPVTRTVTEDVYRCHPVTRLESRTYTAYEDECHNVSHPVTRTRTVYRYEYDYASKSSRSVPRTETYTTYESRYECRPRPVTRSRMESVTSTQCALQPVTHSVTRYEFQFESRFVPPRLETVTRQRLRELAPVCYATAAAAGPPSSTPVNRIEGRVFTRPVERR